MHMIHTIVALNNRGVGYLQTGDHELARIAFKQALERTTYLLTLKREARSLLGPDGMVAARYGSVSGTGTCCRQGERGTNSLEERLSSHCNVSLQSRRRQLQQQQQQLQAISQHRNSVPQGQQAHSQQQEHHPPPQQQPQLVLPPRQHQQHHHRQQVTQRLDSVQRIPISASLTCRYTGSYISSHALLLSNECCTNPIEYEYCHRESACVMFNLALVHHWRGMHFGISSLLPKALKLYEMSFALIQNGATFDTQHLTVALLNNMGHIHHELLQYNNARRCFKSLKEILTARAASATDGPDIQGFLLNIMFLEAPGLAPAA
ncbi:hypothetical protein MHU86_8867 [Fragilaria crotonensis]|nr:hypothetical protein MHU86_8867 [Fragilaria crotonensis]